MTADALPPAAHAAMAEIDRPLPSANPTLWGSDAIAEVLRDLGLPYAALNPGASFRGLHDSMVNYLGNRTPQMLLCLHEENAVAIAHGYAKMTGKPMAAIVHSNVGLMHASMAVFDAWCDRVPVIVFGATGHFDAPKRRPWIEWIHTAQDQGALIRNFVKYDDQPHSPAAARESILRAVQIATTPPMGPVYINLDVAIQEMRIGARLPPIDVGRYRAPPPVQPDAALVAKAAKVLAGAKAPLILVGRIGLGEAAWRDRVALAEKLGARVLTDLKAPAGFPTDHPLHAAPPGMFPHPKALEAVKNADAILSLDWIDLAGLLRTAWGGDGIGATIIQASLDQHVHHGWSKDHQGLPPIDHYLLTEPDVAVRALLTALKDRPAAARPRGPAPEAPTVPLAGTVIEVPMVAHALRAAAGNKKVTLLRIPLSWGGQHWPIVDHDGYMGFDGGAGIGSGPGMVVGGALALRDLGKSALPVAVLGDGDFLMSVTAFWTAAHYKIPLLVLVVNNRSFFNDEIHQERVAQARERPVANRWIGQRIGEPEIDLAAMARAQGCVGLTVEEPARLTAAIAEGIKAVEAGKVCIVDVRVAPGYDASTVAALDAAKKA